MGEDAELGLGWLRLPVIAAMARLLCWGRHCDWDHSTRYGAERHRWKPTRVAGQPYGRGAIQLH
jgi:hypothetical protein